MNDNPNKDQINVSNLLDRFSVVSVDYNSSWKKHYVNERFSEPNALHLPKEEKERFVSRLEDMKIGFTKGKTFRSGWTGTGLDLIRIIVRGENRSVDKLSRSMAFGLSTGRSSGNQAYFDWTGFQVIDIDCKDPGIARKIKQYTSEQLCHCNWYFGSFISSSGMGVHIYTYIQPQETNDLKTAKALFHTNFRHKYTMVYLSIRDELNKLGYDNGIILDWIDQAMDRPQQGVFISSDPDPFVNSRFFVDHMHICFGDSSLWKEDMELARAFEKHKVEVEDRPQPTEIEVVSVEKSEHIDPKHYKYNERWRLANTLVNLYGKEGGYKILREVCLETSGPELYGLCITADHHQKPLDRWAVKELNERHGFKIRLDYTDGCSDQVLEASRQIADPNHIGAGERVSLYINKDQYLGHILPEIKKNLGRITLIEAGPGLGKTEMIKMMKSDSRILMVMPFTSTIKSKVEQEDGWDFSYGGKTIDIYKSEHAAITIDKFTQLSPSRLQLSGFDYVVIDESHLMFLSEYRPVMTKAIEMIRQMDIPIILLSGTPSGEFLFFPGITHIHVTKEDVRVKYFEVTIADDQKTLIYRLARAMASDIMDGHRVLYPTNLGSAFAAKVEASVNFFLAEDYGRLEPVKLKYYKRSKVGEDWMDDINFKATINDIEILMCTSYLSVGVDIKDKYDFRIYFSELYMANEVDQWTNRLRGNDLFVNLYISKTDSDGELKDIFKYNHLSFKELEEERLNNEAILTIINNDVKRGNYEITYNPIVQNLITGCPYIIWDTDQSRYIIDDICYKVVSFERKYRAYCEQLPVLVRGMECYGYDIQVSKAEPIKPEDIGIFTDVKEVCTNATAALRQAKNNYVTELLQYITDANLSDFYTIMEGKVETLVGPRWGMSRGIMRVRDAEVFNKVIPIMLSLTKRYDLDDAKKFFTLCTDKKGNYNFAAIGRLRTLSNVLFSKEEGMLHVDVETFMNDCKEFIEPGEVTVVDMDDFLSRQLDRYMGRFQITYPDITKKKALRVIENIFKVFVNTKKKGDTIAVEPVSIMWKTKREKMLEFANQIFEIGQIDMGSFLPHEVTKSEVTV